MKLVSHATLLVNLGTLCVVIAMAELRNVRRWGPKYCQNLCTAGCSSSPGNIVEHRCHRSQTKSAQKHEDKDDKTINVTKEVVTKDVRSHKTCSETFTVAQGEESIPKCIKRFTRPNRSGKMTRLLFAEVTGAFYQIYLNNQHVVKYQYLSSGNPKEYLKGMSGMAFISSRNQLVFCAFQNKGLYLSPLDSNTLIPIKHKLAGMLWNVAVDELHQLVFLTSCAPKQCIKVMSTEGTHLKVAFTTPPGCAISEGITVDPKQSHIFLVCKRKSIDMLTYTGKFIKHVVVGAVDGPLLFDSLRNIFYYNNRMNIYEFNLQSNKTKPFVKLTDNPAPYRFALDKTNLYVSSLRLQGLFVVDRFSVVKEIKIDKTFNYGQVCLVA